MKDQEVTPQGGLIVSEITETDWQKIRNDLHFIDLMTSSAKKKGYRLIVSGGYAADGCLGRITRPHRDIDIPVYGQNNATIEVVREFVAGVKENEPAFSGVEVKDKGRQEFYHSYFAEGNGLGADIYYIQVTGNPFSQEKFVVKKDGSVTEKQEFETVKVSLEGISFEAVAPVPLLADKLSKQVTPKHNQDIANLRLITNAEEVAARLRKIRG